MMSCGFCSAYIQSHAWPEFLGVGDFDFIWFTNCCQSSSVAVPLPIFLARVCISAVIPSILV